MRRQKAEDEGKQRWEDAGKGGQSGWKRSPCCEAYEASPTAGPQSAAQEFNASYATTVPESDLIIILSGGNPLDKLVDSFQFHRATNLNCC